VSGPRQNPRGWRLAAFGAVVCAATACGPSFLVLAKIDDAIEDHKDRRLPPYLCGNAICDRSRGESCQSCPADCGTCATAPPQLVALAPESGPAGRWVAIFGTHLDRVGRLWLARGAALVPLRHRRAGTALEVFIPPGSKGGVLHMESRGRRLPTRLSYSVLP
jgi:hypothetical protein